MRQLRIILLAVLSAVFLDFYWLFQNSTYQVGPLYSYFLAIFANKMLFAVYVGVCLTPVHFLVSKWWPERDDVFKWITLFGVFVYLVCLLAPYIKLNYYAGLSLLHSSVLWTTTLMVVSLVVVLLLLNFLNEWTYTEKLITVSVVVAFVVVFYLPWHLAYVPPPVSAQQARYPEQPNLIFMMVDTVHAKHMSSWGHGRDTTPNLKEFSEDGVRFKRMFSTSSWTQPSVATMFTGQYPQEHSANQLWSKLPREALTLAEILRNKGYRTAGFSSNVLVSPQFGMAQGFDRFHNTKMRSPLKADKFSRVLAKLEGLNDYLLITEFRDTFSQDASVVNERGMEWVKREWNREHPFFLYLHYMDPHQPYDPPNDHLGEKNLPDDYFHATAADELKKDWWPAWKQIFPFGTRTPPSPEVLENTKYLYDSEIRYWDHEFGEFQSFLEEQQLLENSIVVVLSDHGEEFFQHGNWPHGHSLFNELIHVPFVIRTPNTPEKETQVVDRPYSLVGLKDSLLTLMDLPSQSTDHDMASAVRAEGGDTGDNWQHPPIYANWQQELKQINTVIQDEWKLLKIQNENRTAWRLYDISNDYGEQNDLRSQYPERLKTMKQRLNDWIEAMEERELSGASVQRDQGLEQQLKGLGYME